MRVCFGFSSVCLPIKKWRPRRQLCGFHRVKRIRGKAPGALDFRLRFATPGASVTLRHLPLGATPAAAPPAAWFPRTGPVEAEPRPSALVAGGGPGKGGSQGAGETHAPRPTDRLPSPDTSWHPCTPGGAGVQGQLPGVPSPGRGREKSKGKEFTADGTGSRVGLLVCPAQGSKVFPEQSRAR